MRREGRDPRVCTQPVWRLPREGLGQCADREGPPERDWDGGSGERGPPEGLGASLMGRGAPGRAGTPREDARTGTSEAPGLPGSGSVRVNAALQARRLRDGVRREGPPRAGRDGPGGVRARRGAAGRGASGRTRARDYVMHPPGWGRLEPGVPARRRRRPPKPEEGDRERRPRRAPEPRAGPRRHPRARWPRRQLRNFCSGRAGVCRTGFKELPALPWAALTRW